MDPGIPFGTDTADGVTCSTCPDTVYSRVARGVEAEDEGIKTTDIMAPSTSL
jgi:hypothetical protein